MSQATISTTETRYLGVDLHKHYLVIGGVNARQEVVLAPRRIELDDWPAWAKAHLRQTDVVVVEATGNTWTFYDEVVALVTRVEVANAGKIALIANTRVKTDKHDVMKLAKLSAAGLIPEVWVPPQPVRELRMLMSHRRRLVKVSTLVKNRMQSLLHRHHLAPPDGESFSQANRAWWANLDVSVTERLHLKHDLATLQQVEAQLAEVDAELNRLSTTEPWASQMPYLMQLPGVARTRITALTVLAAIGDVMRFESAKQLVGYAGLGASVHDSGLTHRTGRITKTGRRDLRWVLVEAAWAVDHVGAGFAPALLPPFRPPLQRPVLPGYLPSRRRKRPAKSGSPGRPRRAQPAGLDKFSPHLDGYSPTGLQCRACGGQRMEQVYPFHPFHPLTQCSRISPTNSKTSSTNWRGGGN
jgi:transposase